MNVKQFGEVWVANAGAQSCIGTTPECATKGLEAIMNNGYQIEIPLKVDIDRRSREKIVRDFLREKSGLMNTHNWATFISGREKVTEFYDNKGKTILTTRNSATDFELAADLILKSLT